MMKSSPAQQLLNRVCVIVMGVMMYFYTSQMELDYITTEQYVGSVGNLALWGVAIWSSMTLMCIVIREKLVEMEREEKRNRRVSR